MPQQQVGSGLIALTVSFQPFQDVAVQADRHGFLWGSIELAHLGFAPIQNKGYVRKINVLVFHGRDGGDISFLFLGELPHKLSFHVIPRFGQR